ncbi:hypothetical protein GCM10010272_53600 [Streptomyces lateritius]|nr:hypothetical protein GCM10010272_53600 [Streptomyces lateritius]
MHHKHGRQHSGDYRQRAREIAGETVGVSGQGRNHRGPDHRVKADDHEPDAGRGTADALSAPVAVLGVVPSRRYG